MAPNFLTAANQLNILRDAAFVGIIAWGMTLILIAGEIDISVGPHVAFAGIMLAKLAQAGVSLPLAVVLVLLLGACIGTAAGWLRAQFDVPSFIVTLSLWLALRGISTGPHPTFDRAKHHRLADVGSLPAAEHHGRNLNTSAVIMSLPVCCRQHTIDE